MILATKDSFSKIPMMPMSAARSGASARRVDRLDIEMLAG
jgi:hypothetical protein